MNFIEDIFKGISDLITSILNVVKRILPYVLLAIAAWYTMGGSLAFLTELGIEAGAMTGLYMAGTSFLFAPDETAAIVVDSVHALGDVASAVGTEAGNLLNDVTSSLLSGPAGWLIIGVGAYFLFSVLSKNSDKTGGVPIGENSGKAGGVLIGDGT